MSSAAARARARREILARAGEPQTSGRSRAELARRRTPLPNEHDTDEHETDRDGAESASHLRVVPRVAPRGRVMSKASLIVTGLCVFTISVIVFQATIAEQQLRLDALTSDLRMAESHYDVLRQRRAELLMPGRLREEAVMLGMYQGVTSKFVDVSPDVVAEVMASTSKMNPLFADPPASAIARNAVAQAASGAELPRAAASASPQVEVNP